MDERMFSGPPMPARERTHDHEVQWAARVLGGYGALMHAAERLWGDELETQGIHRSGAKAVGPVVAALVPCGCLDGLGAHRCEWCCGAGRVTKRVREAQAATAVSPSMPTRE